MVSNLKQPMLIGGKVSLSPIDGVYECYFRWVHDTEVTRYLELGRFPQTEEALEKYLKDHFILGINAEGKYIGNIALTNVEWIHRTAYIGIMIGEKDCWGKGYGTDAINLLFDHAVNRLNLRKISAGAYRENHGSIRAFQKAGFEIEAVFKKQLYLDGKYQDRVVMSKFG